MAKENIDILLDANGDDKVVGGDFAIGDGTLDDCIIIMKLTTGSLKSDPKLGPNLVEMNNAKKSPTEIQQVMKLHLKRDNKTVKSLKIVNGEIKLEI